MPFNATYAELEPPRDEIDALPGLSLIEFGAPWCGHCIAAQTPLAAAMQDRGGVRHIKVEDGPGRRLGRSFRIKLWPTLVLMRDGQEVGRVVRPRTQQEIGELLHTA